MSSSTTARGPRTGIRPEPEVGDGPDVSVDRDLAAHGRTAQHRIGVHDVSVRYRGQGAGGGVTWQTTTSSRRGTT